MSAIKTEMKRSLDAEGELRVLYWPQTHLSQRAFSSVQAAFLLRVVKLTF